MTSLPFSYTLESGTSIEMLLNRDVINSINNFFCRKLILESNHSAFHGMFVRLIYAVCTPLVPYSLKIYSPFMASSPQLSGQSIVPRKRSQSGWRSCSGELAVFCWIFFLYIFLLKGSFLFRVCTKIKDNMKNPCIPVIFPEYISKGFLPLTDKLTLFLYSEIRDCHRNAAKSERC